MNYPEEERDTKAEVTPVNVEAIIGETKASQEYEYEGEIEVDEVVGKIIKNMQSYYIEFQLIFFR